MNDDEATATTKRDWKLLCEVCAQPITGEMDICPECKSPIVRPDEIIAAEIRKEKDLEKLKRKKGLAFVLDLWSIYFVCLVLLSSFSILFRVLYISNDDWMKNSEIFRWIYGYFAAVMVAFAVLYRLMGRLEREDEKHTDD